MLHMQIKASTIFTTYFPLYYFRFVCFIRSYFKYHISFNTDAVVRQTCVSFFLRNHLRERDLDADHAWLWEILCTGGPSWKWHWYYRNPSVCHSDCHTVYHRRKLECVCHREHMYTLYCCTIMSPLLIIIVKLLDAMLMVDCITNSQ